MLPTASYAALPCVAETRQHVWRPRAAILPRDRLAGAGSYVLEAADSHKVSGVVDNTVQEYAVVFVWSTEQKREEWECVHRPDLAIEQAVFAEAAVAQAVCWLIDQSEARWYPCIHVNVAMLHARYVKACENSGAKSWHWS
jgi:hypothetical protein